MRRSDAPTSAAPERNGPPVPTGGGRSATPSARPHGGAGPRHRPPYLRPVQHSTTLSAGWPRGWASTWPPRTRSCPTGQSGPCPTRRPLRKRSRGRSDDTGAAADDSRAPAARGVHAEAVKESDAPLVTAHGSPRLVFSGRASEHQTGPSMRGRGPPVQFLHSFSEAVETTPRSRASPRQSATLQVPWRNAASRLGGTRFVASSPSLHRSSPLERLFRTPAPGHRQAFATHRLQGSVKRGITSRKRQRAEKRLQEPLLARMS